MTQQMFVIDTVLSLSSPSLRGERVSAKSPLSFLGGLKWSDYVVSVRVVGGFSNEGAPETGTRMWMD